MEEIGSGQNALERYMEQDNTKLQGSATKAYQLSYIFGDEIRTNPHGYREAAGESNEGISAELHFRRQNSYQPTWLQTAESTCSAGAPPNFYSFERQLILLDSTFADISQHHKNTV
eukprot:CAMPEP_0175021130 /NCGR_PEP_ID=MMETSP0005-20121125/14534_1 /TAXON_ID=420556 /ORGANISM="Ochromonas sp., Strain CCMP1393" /LENGTH=115 /DNA_ID=CAMNT_0016279125 /DNA_START=1372 /DNA_END=1720 /DNA_ORIENTATION=+